MRVLLPNALALVAVLALVALDGCRRSSAPGGAATCSSGSVATAGSATAWQEPPDPPPALATALDDALAAIEGGDAATADAKLSAADALVGGDAHLAYLVARVRATRFVQVGDFERAAQTFVALIPTLAEHPELRDEFSAHNTMMMIREAQGDPASALAENDQATLCAARGTWDPDGRETLAFQKDRWHRAYLTRMLAESRKGAAKDALVQYARAALDDYRTRGFPDSIAVLEAYFAALDGRPTDAVAAARRVDLAKDDDVEDLYLVVVGLEGGGDHAGAESVRQSMRSPSPPRISRAIMLRWLDLDAKWPSGGGFTPWHATAP